MGITNQFRNYLAGRKISARSVKNYLADVRHFLAFKNYQDQEVAGLAEVESLGQIFTQESLEDYKQKFLLLGIPLRTLNRRLSALRQFGQFLVSQSFLSENPALKISNINPSAGGQKSKRGETEEQEKILKEFKAHLWEKGASKATMKNYQADIKQFLSWVEKVS